VNGYVPLLVVPIGLALVVAVALGRLLKKQPKFVPLPFRAMLAILSPVLAVVIYFWVWQRIDYAIHQSSGGGDYMGPMTMLVYGAPIFGITSS
jgi:hypothetical protein